MENSNQKIKETDALDTKNLAKKLNELRKKNREVNKKLDDLRSETEKLLHPENQQPKNE